MERESSLDERLRKDKERADAIRERQIRLGHVPDPARTEARPLAEPAPQPPPKQKAAPKRAPAKKTTAKKTTAKKT